jgi:hypothetical protein
LLEGIKNKSDLCILEIRILKALQSLSESVGTLTRLTSLVLMACIVLKSYRSRSGL